LRSAVEHDIAFVAQDHDLSPSLDYMEAPAPCFLDEFSERSVPLYVVAASPYYATRPRLLGLEDLINPCAHSDLPSMPDRSRMIHSAACRGWPRSHPGEGRSAVAAARRSCHHRVMPDRSRKRPRDLNRLAEAIVGEATGEEPSKSEDEPHKDAAAVELGRRGGLKGGPARAQRLSKQQRSDIARQAARARWNVGRKGQG
jgi:hypothetical protein